MSVRPTDLDRQERDLDLATREAAPPRRSKKLDDALREKLERARTMKPLDLHWWEFWRQGRDAAIAAIEAAGDTSRARELVAPDGIGCGDCYRKGRDAVVKLIEEGP